MNKVKLKSAVSYSKERGGLNELSIDTYISTDNLLQNKEGIAMATNLPPNGNSFPKYLNGDILISNIRPYLKKIWYASNEGLCSSDVLTLKTNKRFSSKFIYYNLHQDSFFEHMMKGSKGTKMPRGDKAQVLEFEVPDYPLLTQRKIAAVLSALDDKIELNNTINAELEAMAKTLYDYWFVQFDFPTPSPSGRAGVWLPYKSSGGKMVYNEELKREIPEGWEDGELKDISNITMGQSPPGESYNENGEGMIFFQGCTDFGNRYPTVRKFTTAPTRFAKAGEILLSVRAPVGTLNIAKDDCCIGRGLSALNSKDGCISYLFGVMTNLKQIFDRRNVDGTTFGSITKDDLFSLKVVKPNKEILKKYNSIINPAFQKQNKIEMENMKLGELRDWLLPMLMNGQVSVGNSYEKVEEVLSVAAEKEVSYGNKN